jgi:signal recognition particle receptor subunit beta
VQFNGAQREIVLKVVYYGPPLSGKTTNLQAIHNLLGGGVCGRLTTLDTADDRTLFFDLLPVLIKSRSGYRIKLKLFTVPGQVIHAATRRLVLQGADGVVFVGDSQLSQARANGEFWQGMRQHISDNNIDPDTLPTVIQFNKRDLPGTRSDEELEMIAAKSNEPLFKAVAIRGEGVLETLHGLLQMLFIDLNRKHDFERKFHISSHEFLNGVFGAARNQP